MPSATVNLSLETPFFPETQRAATYSVDHLLSEEEKERIKAVLNHALNRPLDKEVSESSLKQAFAGMGLGVLGGSLFSSTGCSTFIHEYFGHIVLGGNLTHESIPGYTPHYQVDGFENFKQIFKADSLSESLKWMGRWLSGYDFDQDGAAGFAERHQGAPNALGEAMGKSGLDAWISISGSLPGLVIDTSLVAGGMILLPKNVFLGSLLLSCGMMDHLANSSYLWSAASMGVEEMKSHAWLGHDFANFALKMSNVTGINPKVIATGTAVGWTCFVPLVAAGIYFYQKSHTHDIVPNRLAFQHWIQNPSNQEEATHFLEKCLENYPRKEQISHALSSMGPRAIHLESFRFARFALNKMTKKDLKNSKIAILQEAQQDTSEELSTTDKVLKLAPIAMTVVSTASRVLTILGETLLPTILTVATTVSYTLPLMGLVSVILSGKQAYEECTQSDTPQSVKMISVAQLVMSVTSVILLCIGLFVPQIAVIILAFELLRTLIAVILSYARQKILKQEFEIKQAVQDDEWNYMYTLLQAFKEDLPNVPYSQSNQYELYDGLKKWVELQRLADNRQLLSEQKRRFLELLDSSLLHPNSST